MIFVLVKAVQPAGGADIGNIGNVVKGIAVVGGIVVVVGGGGAGRTTCCTCRPNCGALDVAGTGGKRLDVRHHRFTDCQEDGCCFSSRNACMYLEIVVLRSVEGIQITVINVMGDGVMVRFRPFHFRKLPYPAFPRLPFRRPCFFFPVPSNCCVHVHTKSIGEKVTLDFVISSLA